MLVKELRVFVAFGILTKIKKTLLLLARKHNTFL